MDYLFIYFFFLLYIADTLSIEHKNDTNKKIKEEINDNDIVKNDESSLDCSKKKQHLLPVGTPLLHQV